MFVGLMLDTWVARPLLVPALVSLFGGRGDPERPGDPPAVPTQFSGYPAATANAEEE